MFDQRKLRTYTAIVLLGGLVFFYQNCANENLSSTPLPSTAAESTDPSIINVTPTDPEDPHKPAVEIEKTTFEPILVDRYYLKSLFEDIFGPTAFNVETTKALLNAQEYGSPCSIYRDQNTYNSAKGLYLSANSMEQCSRNAPNLVIAQVNPSSTATRQALLTRSCSDLTTNNNTLKFALKKISSAAVPEATSENIKTLFRLFYRDQSDPPNSLVESLLVMIPQQSATLDHWRSAVFTVCASSYWQVL